MITSYATQAKAQDARIDRAILTYARNAFNWLPEDMMTVTATGTRWTVALRDGGILIVLDRFQVARLCATGKLD